MDRTVTVDDYIHRGYDVFLFPDIQNLNIRLAAVLDYLGLDLNQVFPPPAHQHHLGAKMGQFVRRTSAHAAATARDNDGFTSE